ncbi:NADH dehydrogenase [ubiquinone] 1 alpha subcomplex subunit 9, mitochondrial [Planococcus citri]|uniref:NADH dehydrogenase [ubiquinone] 1 alpha subcomplex subunit 9, mitochondrial n=1 Tax=Planococcus citri TaxID=170843 RepID=UPI0031F8A9DA
MALRITISKCVNSRTPALLESKRFSIIASVSYSKEVGGYRIIENTDLAALKRGTGYRSSFNGTICTVFGCTGLIGRGLVNRLGRNGTQIIAAYRGSAYDVTPLKVCADLGQMYFTPFHLRDEESIRTAVRHSNVVVNLIGQDCDSMNFKLEEVHIDGARRVARICREMGVKKLIHISAMGASPNPKKILVPGGSRFLKSKYAGEQAVREEFPDAIIVRPADVYGECDRFLYYYCRRERYFFRKLHLHEGGVNTIKAPISVNDFNEGLFELVTRPKEQVNGKTYQFVGPQHYYLNELAGYIMGILLKLPESGYEILDSRLSLSFLAYLHIRNTFYLVKPAIGMHLERFERENTSDILDKDLPTIADLGVKLHTLDLYIKDFTRAYRNISDYGDEVYELDFPSLPAPAQGVYA